MTSSSWTSGVTKVEPNEVRVRGYDIAELMGKVSFGQAVYLILRGDLPDDATGDLMEAMIVASIDHGATPPSVLAARTVASTGASLSASVAAGILSINNHHGGAIETCACQLGTILKRANGGDLETAAREQLAEWKQQGQHMPGFGHHVHSNDRRTTRLFELAEIAGTFGDHCHAARAVEAVFKATDNTLPINVDGAMGALLADLGFEPDVMNGIFMIARVAGLLAHVTEEQTRCRPMRTIDPIDHDYDGPGNRSLV